MMYEIATGHAVCDIGNRRAAVFWQVKLLTAFGVALTLLYLALDRLDSTFARFFLWPWSLSFFFTARFRRRQAGGRYS